MDWKEALGKLSLPDAPETDAPDNDISTSEVSAKPQKLRCIRDKKQRNGKTATIIEGFECEEEEVKKIAKDLKKRMGVGGSVRGSEILLQGDCRQKAADELRAMGHKVTIV